MIKSFKDKWAEKVFSGQVVSKWRAIHRQIERRLQILDSASELKDLRGLPSNHFEALKGDRRGQYSIRVNKQWRICFQWINEEAVDVEIIDYHK